MTRLLRLLLYVLGALFCFAYPFAVVGVAFDVRPPFSLAWAGSALLFLEGALLLLSAALLYGKRRAFLAGSLVIVLSYLAEAIGVNTGWPFGSYRYTDVLLLRLPGAVPLAVMFAWILIVFGAYGWLRRERGAIGIRGALLGALLAALLDLAIEPVSAHVVFYWQWLAPGNLNYYGVPLENFVAWFCVAFLLLLLIDRILAIPLLSRRNEALFTLLVPRLLFVASLFMFALVDLTHGYYGALLPALLAGLLLVRITRRRRRYR